MQAVSSNMDCSGPGNLIPCSCLMSPPRGATWQHAISKQVVAHLATGGDSGPQAGASEGVHQSGGHRVQRELDCASRGK